jgi:dihydrolipoamide dehydrogenase
MAEGIALAELAAGGKQWKFRAIPSCVYTDPEVASVGLTEAEAQKQKLPVRVSRVPLTAVGRSLTLGRSEGLCKLVVDAESDKVLGAAIVGPQADALVAEATLAVELGLTARQLGRVVHAHPTMSELLFEAAEAVHGRAVHIVNR